jgi:hypothetical protein
VEPKFGFEFGVDIRTAKQRSKPQTGFIENSHC